MKNLSLNFKIWSILLLLTAAFIGSTTFGGKNLSRIKDDLNEITQVFVKRNERVADIRDNQRKITSLTMQLILVSDPEKIQQTEKSLAEVLDAQKSDFESYKSIASEQGKVYLEKYMAEYATYLPVIDEVRKLARQNKNAEATELLFAKEEILTRMRAIMRDLNDFVQKRMAEVSDQANAAANDAIRINTITAAVSISMSLLIAFLVLRSVTGTINQVVKNLFDSSVQVSGAAGQIASASEELSQAATEQAASLEETAASVEEMSSMIAKNSDNAKSAADTSDKSEQTVNQGKEVIKKMAESMTAINRSSEEMAEIVKVIEQIDKKTKVINEIVNKTELLSFNASVEAARAGEHGKGFAVVAEEVGNLARMSGNAAEEIATLLDESNAKVRQLVEETKRNVSLGAQVTQECGTVFDTIVQNVSSVAGMATEIASASQEQSRGVTEITKAMSQLDQMTQQNASTSEECASSAEELSAQAETLKDAVAQLVLVVLGQTSQNATQSHKNTQSSAPRASNVVAMKDNKSRNSAAPKAKGAPMKKASGVPDYDSDGFREI